MSDPTSPALPDLAAASAVLLDLDGVLTPTAVTHRHAWAEAFTQLFADWGVTPEYTDADYYAHLDGRRRDDGVAALLHSRNIEVPWGEPGDGPDAETVRGIGARKNLAFLAVLQREGIAPYPGSLALIEGLQRRGVPMAVVSSSRNAEEVLRAAGIRELFAVIVDGVRADRENLASKPAGDMFARAAALLGAAPADCAAVEDALSGVASAAAAGVAAVIGVDRGAGAEPLRAAGAGWVVDDLARLLPALGRDVPASGTPAAGSPAPGTP